MNSLPQPWPEIPINLENFQNPPREYGILPFWFLNGALEPEEMRYQLKEFREKGMPGIILHGRYGLEMPYIGEKYLDRIRLAVEEAKKIGLQNWIYFDISPDSARVRYDFYTTLTEFYSQAYYQQIYDWCQQHGVLFTGHMMYEEWLRRLIRVEGNLFKHLNLHGGDRPYAVGYLDLQPAELRFDWAERNMHSDELLAPLGGDCLVYVAPAESLDQPERMPGLDRFQVFRVRCGQAVLLHRGVWHGAPLALDQPLNVLVLLLHYSSQQDVFINRFEATPVAIRRS